MVKLLSCILIATHHYAGQCVCNGDEKMIWRIMTNYGGVAGVAIFFFLSGYGLMKSELVRHLNLKEFFWKRIVKLYLPTILVGGITCLIWATVFHTQYTILSLISSILFLNSDMVFWFLKVLMVWYAVFYVFIAVRHRAETLAPFLLIAFGIAITCGEYCIEDPLHSINAGWFAVGVLSAHPCRKSVVIITSIMASGGVIYLLHSPNSHLFIHALCGLAAVATVLLLAKLRLAFVFPAFLKDLSYDIYLVHGKVNHLTYLTNGQLWYVTYLSLVIVTALLFHFVRRVCKM